MAESTRSANNYRPLMKLMIRVGIVIIGIPMVGAGYVVYGRTHNPMLLMTGVIAVMLLSVTHWLLVHQQRRHCLDTET